jgi:hypothetical protein
MVLQQYGAGAADHAGGRADALGLTGDMAGQAVWIRIREAILEMQRGSAAMH